MLSCRHGEAFMRETGVASGEKQAYRRLQEHLDRQPVGFPAVPSGADLRLLAQVFTPLEAEAALFLRGRPEPFAVIRERARSRFPDPGELQALLDSAHRKGGVHAIERDGATWYGNAPLVVGIYEMQLGRLSPALLADVEAYLGDARFGVSFLSTPKPQMRTIPIGKSITPQHHVSTFDEVDALLRVAAEPFVLVECICRKKAGLKGHSCKVTSRAETCLGMGPLGASFLRAGNGRRISREEAIAVIAKNQEEGLVLQPSNSQSPEFICSCCGCCCGMLSMHRDLPIPIEFWTSNFRAAVDEPRCIGCGICVRKCQAAAIAVPREGAGKAIVDPTRCLGCGLCVPSCPKNALVLEKKMAETKPPATMEALFEIFRNRRSRSWDKLRTVARLLWHMLRTGRYGLLKRK